MSTQNGLIKTEFLPLPHPSLTLSKPEIYLSVPFRLIISANICSCSSSGAYLSCC